MNAKTCKQCRATKPLSGFYPDPKCADGHRTECRECTRANNLANKALKKMAGAA